MELQNGIRRISETIWEIPQTYKSGMRVPARIIATEELFRAMDASVFDQLSNVATLPGIVDFAYCMPDGHSGYGFPIGGVAAIDPRSGVISPGGIGFDINCGVRLIRTNLTEDEVRPRLHALVGRLFERVPTGVGSTGFLKPTTDEFREIVETGSRWCEKRGFASSEDLELTEDNGCSPGANSEHVSQAAIDRGIRQIGTLGSGNHYLEIQVVKEENIIHPALAKHFGLSAGQVVVMFHCGSRGFGHQIASDYLKLFLRVMESKYNLTMPDRELACAPFESPEGQAYFSAMKCAINMSFANRQVILHRVREAFSETFHRDPAELGLNMIYDVSHNTAKLEEHEAGGVRRRLLVHRKGATRAFGPGMEGVPGRYRETGQPVLIGGSMESASYLLVGSREGRSCFFSTAHGSGRVMSRHKAKQQFNGRNLAQDMQKRGIFVKTASFPGLAEEAGAAYKDIDQVIAATAAAGLSIPVLKLIPIGNVKG